MGGKSKIPPPPNYAPIAAASEASARYSFDLGKEQLAWAREQYANDSARLDKQEATFDQVIKDAMSRQDKLDTQAASDRKRYEEVYQPLEDKLVTEAGGYTDERNAARAEAEAGRAAAAVSNQVAAARAAAQERLESFGIDPSQSRAGLDKGLVEEGAARAGAANQTREGVRRAEEATGRALRSEALNIGKGYPGQVAQQYGLAFQQGQGASGTGAQAVQSGLATTASGASTMGTGTQWQGLGNQGLTGWGNALNMGFSNSLEAAKAKDAQSSGWGTALGLIGGIGLKAAASPIKPFWMQEGGAVPVTSEVIPEGEGKRIEPQHSPSRGRAIDDVHVMAQPDEFIVPRETVMWVGEKHLQKLIEKSKEEKAQAQAKPAQSAVPVEAHPPTLVREPQDPGLMRSMVARASGAVNRLGERMRGPEGALPIAALGIRG
jgi:hypothetical protein